MKTAIITLVLFGATAFGGTVWPVAPRQANQQARIAQGVRSGELTPGEALRLAKQEHALSGQIRRDRTDGGGLSAAERSKIRRRQDALSRRIHTLKNNSRTR